MRIPYRRTAALSAALVAASASVPVAAATPNYGVDAVTLSQTTVDGRAYLLREITIAPGGSTGWHWHAGTVFGVVRQGTLTHQRADCSLTASTVPAIRSPSPAGPTMCTSAAIWVPHRW